MTDMTNVPASMLSPEDRRERANQRYENFLAETSDTRREQAQADLDADRVERAAADRRKWELRAAVERQRAAQEKADKLAALSTPEGVTAYVAMMNRNRG